MWLICHHLSTLSQSITGRENAKEEEHPRRFFWPEVEPRFRLYMGQKQRARVERGGGGEG